MSPDRVNNKAEPSSSQGTVTITLKLFATLTRFLPSSSQRNQAQMTFPSGMTVGGVISQMSLPLEECHLVLVNGVFIPPPKRDTTPLKPNDALAIWPPVAGG